MRQLRRALRLSLVRDGNGPRALQTLIRCRSSALAELSRGLGPLEALRAPARAIPHARSLS